MATPRALSAFNGFVPKATGQVISWIRDPNKFKLTKYTQMIESPATVGLYAKIHRDDPARVVSDADFVWADGADRPQGEWNNLRFEWVEFSVTRRNYPFRIGHMAIAGAKDVWKPVEHHTGMALQQAWTNKTNRLMSLLETESNWASGHVQSANDLNGGAGKWDTASGTPGSANYNAIKKALLAAAQQINLDTNGLVEPDDLVLLISPILAIAMASAPEIHEYLKYGPFSKAELEGRSNVNATWGLPPSLYGFEVIVENTPYVNVRPLASGATTSSGRAYAKEATSAVMLSRKGGINGQYGAPNFSTLQMYWHEYEAAVEIFDDPVHKRLQGNVVDAFKEVLASSESGMLINGCI